MATWLVECVQARAEEEGIQWEIHLIALCNGLVAIVRVSLYLLLALDESISVDTKHEFGLFIWFECRGDDYIITRRNTEPSRHLKSNKHQYLVLERKASMIHVTISDESHFK